MGFMFPVNGGPVVWARKLQSTVASSTFEAQYVAAGMTKKEALWLRKVLAVLGADGQAVPMGKDNQSCFAPMHNSETSGRTKHM